MLRSNSPAQRRDVACATTELERRSARKAYILRRRRGPLSPWRGLVSWRRAARSSRNPSPTFSSVLLVGKRYGEAFAIWRIDYGDGYCVTDARHVIHLSYARQMIKLV